MIEKIMCLIVIAILAISAIGCVDAGNIRKNFYVKENDTVSIDPIDTDIYINGEMVYCYANDYFVWYTQKSAHHKFLRDGIKESYLRVINDNMVSNCCY